MPLAILDDVESRLGRAVTAAETERLNVLLDDASAAVVAYTGQTFESADYTARLKVRNGAIRLPQRPVTAVDSIVDMNGNPISFEWWGGDRIEVPGNVIDSWAFEPWRNGIQWVDVTYTAGYTNVPADVVAVVVEKVLRGVGASPGLGGVQSVTLGDAAISYGTVGAAGAAGFFDAERAVLDRYRRPLGTIQVSY